MRACSVILGVVVLLASGRSGEAADGGDGLTGYEIYTDWSDWARVRPGSRAGLASSFDRSGGNADNSQYDSPPGLIREEVVCTVRVLEGPGVIHRFWMPHLTADCGFVVRMFFDGEAVPRINTTSDLLLNGSFGYFTAPFVNTCAGGKVCYEPIPFAESLRIETVNKPLPAQGWSPNNHYYQYSYTLLPKGTPVAAYTGALSPPQQAVRAAVMDMLVNAGAHPAGATTNGIRIETGATQIPAGECLAVGAVDGPGLGRQVSLRMGAATDAELDGLRLRVGYDSAPVPAVDVPVADYFGAGHGRAAYRGLPLGTDSPAGFYCYWPMPFRNSIRVELCNATTTGIGIDSAAFEYEPGPVGVDMGYLHAAHVARVRAAGETYHPLLTATGRGHYVGNLLYVEQPSWSFLMLEGDDVVTADGTTVLYGTGLEDAYNGGYYYNWVGVQSDEPEGPYPSSAVRPLSGELYVHRQSGVEYARADQYRWLIADRVPFRNTLDVKIENVYAVVGSVWRSVAFWYQQPPIPGDTDDDGDLDLADFAAFQQCHAGADTGCLARFDHDEDQDVDLVDFEAFLVLFHGPW